MTTVVSQGSLAPASAAAGEAGPAAVWGVFADAPNQDAFQQAWLTLLCGQIEGALGGILLLGAAPAGPFTPAAIWPDRRRDLTHLTPAAEQALRERRATVRERTAGEQERCFDLGYPVEVGGRLRGVAVVEVGERTPARLQADLRAIHWGMAALEVRFHRADAQSAEAARERVFTLLDLVAVVVEEERFQAACTALVSELATRLDCDRVSLGLCQGQGVRVQAISHNATFGREMNLVRLLEAAMAEAVDQESLVRYPQDPAAPLITAAHADLAGQQGGAVLCSIPIAVKGRFAGALTLERPAGRALDGAEVDLCETLGGLALPILLAKREDERWLIGKAWLALRAQVTRLVGPAHLLRKLAVLVLAAVLIFLSLATGDFRIVANGTLEGGRLRAIVAPFNGYLADARYRAGETVAAGAVLAILDDRDLNLESIKLSTQRAQYQRERREAAAGHDRAKARILSAQLEQAEAQLALVREQLARTRLTAPYDGILVSGDLSQSLGSPVQRGDQLFEIAPVGSFRLVLNVDERDLGYLSEGAPGTLILGALPQTPIPFRVSLITPVTSAAAGRNTFKVEGELLEQPAGLRPGMEGIAKLEAGRRKLIWIWTRTFRHWLRVQTWAWLP